MTSLLARWDAALDPHRPPPRPLDGSHDERTSFADILKAQLLARYGDLRAAKLLCDGAAARYPTEDAPHYALASIYYSLAVFDAIDRGKYKLQTVPRTKEAVTQLDPMTRRDIVELLNPATNAYGKLLDGIGITKLARIGLGLYLLPSSELVIPQEVIDKAIHDAGLPDVLPILTLLPDKDLVTVLCHVQREVALALVRQPTPMREDPSDVHSRVSVVDRPEMAALHQRVDQLLGATAHACQ